jgi:hypothetical protein
MAKSAWFSRKKMRNFVAMRYKLPIFNRLRLRENCAKMRENRTLRQNAQHAAQSIAIQCFAHIGFGQCGAT